MAKAKKNPATEDIKENEPKKVEEVSAPSDSQVDNGAEAKDNSVGTITEAEFESTVEAKRLAFREEYMKGRWVSRILMSVVLVGLIAAIILVTLNNQVTQIIGYVIAGTILVGMIVFYIINKSKMPNKSKAYIDDVTKVMNAYVFNDPRYTDLVIDPNKKLTPVELALDRAYKQGSEVGNRNCVRGKFDGKDFEINEVAIYFQEAQGKRVSRAVGFLGKYISLSNDLNIEGRYIFNIKPLNQDKLVDQPNDIDDLKIVHEEGNIVVYGPNDKALSTVFGPNLLKEIKTIDVSNPLLNVVIVIWGGHTGVYLSYDDPVTTVPFEHEFKKDAQDKFRGDLLKILDILVK